MTFSCSIHFSCWRYTAKAYDCRCCICKSAEMLKLRVCHCVLNTSCCNADFSLLSSGHLHNNSGIVPGCAHGQIDTSMLSKKSESAFARLLCRHCCARWQSRAPMLHSRRCWQSCTSTASMYPCSSTRECTAETICLSSLVSPAAQLQPPFHSCTTVCLNGQGLLLCAGILLPFVRCCCGSMLVGTAMQLQQRFSYGGCCEQGKR